VEPIPTVNIQKDGEFITNFRNFEETLRDEPIDENLKFMVFK
jgi:hypothetical protein